MSQLQKALSQIMLRLQVSEGRRLTYHELARIAGASERTMAEWMRGATSPMAMNGLLNLMSALDAGDVTHVLTLWRETALRDPTNADTTLKDSEMPTTKSQPTEVRFYRASEKPYGVFSNLYKREIQFEGETFATSEHAYQAGKARKPEVRKWLMEAPSPALLAMAAHGLYVWDIKSDWSKVKFDRMKSVLQAKFMQHEDLRRLLLSTGTARLVESATVDNAVNRLWGEVGGVGKNKLGELLMEVRAELVAIAAPANTRKAAPTAAAKKRTSQASKTASGLPHSKRRTAAEPVAG